MPGAVTAPGVRAPLLFGRPIDRAARQQNAKSALTRLTIAIRTDRPGSVEASQVA